MSKKPSKKNQPHKLVNASIEAERRRVAANKVHNPKAKRAPIHRRR
jgi:hypothetical protein